MKSKQNLADLVAATKMLQYFADEGRIDMAVTQSGGLPRDIMDVSVFRHAVEEIAALRGLTPVNIMINKLSPGELVPRHRDWIRPTPMQRHAPRVERWHLAIQTNENCFWWDEDGGRQHMPLGVWVGPVPYWLKHNAINEGDEVRIHILVDLDCPNPVGSYRD